MKYHRVHGFHYILKGKDWYVLVAGRWHRCAPPKFQTPLLIGDDIQKEEARPEADVEGPSGGTA